MASKSDYYEQQVKDLILEKESLFGDLGNSTVVYEKAIGTKYNVIADCLIFSEKRGVIGVEIKTAHDTTKRLNNQLRGYSAICRYVYVLCSDSQVEHVEQVTNKYHHDHVGIICYDLFDNEPVLGIYKEATPSPEFLTYHLVNILWKAEIVSIFGQLRHPARFKAKATGGTAVKLKKSAFGESGSGKELKGGLTSSKQTKRALINNMIGFIGERRTEQIVVNYFIQGRHDPEKVIHFYHFSRDPNEEKN